MRAEAIFALPLQGAPFRAPAIRRRGQVMALLALFALLPIFLQSFHYLIEVRPLWVVAKATPILLAPLTLIGLIALRLPHIWLYLAILLYTLLLAPILSMLHLENNFAEAMGATVKAWTFTFYFTAAAAFMLLRASEATLARAVLTLAVVNFCVLGLLWIILPLSAYAVDGQGTSMFYTDNERGPRIMLPLAFGMIGLFWLARRFSERPAIWPLLLIALGLGLMFTIYKQRFAIGVDILILLLGLTAGLRRRAPTLFWAMAAAGAGLAGLALMALMADGQISSGLSLRDSLGGSLSVRETSARLLVDFLFQDPLRWIFGIGGTTEYGGIGIQQILRYANFYFSDLGWLGVFGEYGLVGSMLVALAYAAGFREAQRAVNLRPLSPFRHALRDFALYLILVSPIYSATYAPGQIATITAMAIFLQRLGRTPPDGAGLPDRYSYAGSHVMGRG